MTYIKNKPMHIKDLPKDLKELALRRQKEAGNMEDTGANLSYISSSFSWSDTPEGVNFWYHVNMGEFDKAREITSPCYVKDPPAVNNSYHVN